MRTPVFILLAVLLTVMGCADYAFGALRFMPGIGGVQWRYASNLVDGLAMLVLIGTYLGSRR